MPDAFCFCSLYFRVDIFLMTFYSNPGSCCIKWYVFFPLIPRDFPGKFSAVYYNFKYFRKWTLNTHLKEIWKRKNTDLYNKLILLQKYPLGNTGNGHLELDTSKISSLMYLINIFYMPFKWWENSAGHFFFTHNYCLRITGISLSSIICTWHLGRTGNISIPCT